MISTSKNFYQDRLEVNVFKTRLAMGQEAAERVAQKINELLQTKEQLNMIFAAAPSQNEFLEALLAKRIDWTRINAFHMDEYIGLDADAPQGFGNFLRDRIFSKVPFKNVEYLNGNAPDPGLEGERYAGLLQDHPADICCMGIGENTHLAFNDPHVADFNDPKWVKVVDLDLECRQQQVNDGCFNELNEVPINALTLTISTLFNASYAYCMVPGEKKAPAILHTLTEAISEKFPSTILRNHPNAVLFIDEASSALI